MATKDPELQEKLCKRIVTEGLSVRRTEELAAGVKKDKRGKKAPQRDPNILHVERELKEIYGTKVSILPRGKKGILQLEYYGEEELNRLIDMLKSIR